MANIDKNNFLHLDEKHHVEEPFLRQLETMPVNGWRHSFYRFIQHALNQKP